MADGDIKPIVDTMDFKPILESEVKLDDDDTKEIQIPKRQGIFIHCKKCGSHLDLEVKGCNIHVIGTIEFVCNKCGSIVCWPEVPWCNDPTKILSPEDIKGL